MGEWAIDPPPIALPLLQATGICPPPPRPPPKKLSSLLLLHQYIEITRTFMINILAIDSQKRGFGGFCLVVVSSLCLCVGETWVFLIAKKQVAKKVKRRPKKAGLHVATPSGPLPQRSHARPTPNCHMEKRSMVGSCQWAPASGLLGT